MRAHYQATIWNQAHLPRLFSLPPMPKACREFTYVGVQKSASAAAGMYV